MYDNVSIIDNSAHQQGVAVSQPLTSFRLAGVFTLASLLIAGQAHAGAWTLKERTAYNKIAANFFTSKETFGTGAEGFEEFTDYTVNYYGEFGITDRLTVIAQVPLRLSENTTDGQSVDNFGVGDVDIGVRYNLLNEKWVLSSQFLYKAPFLYDEDDDLPLGNGQSDFEFRLQLGRSLYPYGYVGFEAGYRFRSEEPSDEFRYLAEYGFDLNDKVYLRTKLDVIKAIDSTNVELDTTGNPNFPAAFDLGKIEASIGYKFNSRQSIEFTFTESIFGENILDGQTYQLGYVFAL